MSKTPKTPTRAELRRARANVEMLLLEADTLAEHTRPRELVGEMIWASMEFAAKNGICAECWLKMAASALGHSLGIPVKMTIREDADAGEGTVH